MSARSLLAIDCGTSRVVAGRFRRAAAGRLALDWGGVECLPRRERDDEGWLEETGRALMALARRGRLAGACIVGLPAHLTFSRVVALPRVSLRRRRQIVRFEMAQGVPLPRAEVVWAQVAVGTSAGGGGTIVLTAVRRTIIKALGARLGAAGLHPVAMLPAWRALHEGLAYSHPESPGALAVAVGARSTQVIWTGATGFALRTLALGGDTVTDQIAADLGLAAESAETLKLQRAPEPQPGHQAVAAADAFVRRLAGEIARSLAGLGPGGGARPERVYLSGGGAQIDGLASGLEASLHLPVVRHDPQLRLDIHGSGPVLWPSITPALLGDIVGLAAARRGATAGSLLPRSARWMACLGRHRAGLAAAALVLAGAMGGAIWREREAAGTARDRASGVEIAIGELRRLDEGNRRNLARLAETRSRTTALQALVEAKRSWAGFLADLQDRLAPAGDAWLERLQIVLPRPPKRMAPAAAAGTARSAAAADSEQTPPPMRIILTGCLFDPENPLSPPGAGAFARAKAVLAQLRASPYVAAMEDERFDGGLPGVLRFEVTLVPAPGGLR